MRLLLLVVFFAVTASAQSTDGKAIVYVYSLAAPTTLGKLKKPIFLDGKEIADIRPERYFIALIIPGKHAFHLKNKKLGGVEKEFQAGKTYYLRVEWRSGAVISPSGFVSVPEENGAFDIKQLKTVDKGNIRDPGIATLALN